MPLVKLRDWLVGFLCRKRWVDMLDPVPLPRHRTEIYCDNPRLKAKIERNLHNPNWGKLVGRLAQDGDQRGDTRWLHKAGTS